MCTLHVYKPTVRPVASSSLLFDLQVVTLLLAEYILFARANLYYPTTRLRSYFSTIFAAHLHVYTRTLGCKRSLKCILLTLTRVIVKLLLCKQDLQIRLLEFVHNVQYNYGRVYTFDIMSIQSVYS